MTNKLFYREVRFQSCFGLQEVEDRWTGPEGGLASNREPSRQLATDLGVGIVKVAEG